MALVLIVEDEPPELLFAESILQEAGHDTLTAMSYDGAVALLEVGEKPSVALIDQNLAGGASGIVVARAAREYVPDMRVIYTSGAYVSDVARDLFVEESEFLPKPYTPEKLNEAVRRQLKNESKADRRARPKEH